METTFTGNVTGNATGLSGTPNITVGTVTASSFKTSTASTGFLKADGTVDTNTYITQAVPVGSVFHFAASTPPTGYLKANGNTVTNGVGTVQGITADFSALYAILGSTYGAAGKLPDLRGQFIRSWADDGTTYDAGRTFGITQADDFKSHTHTLPQSLVNVSPGTGSVQLWANGSGNSTGSTPTPTTGGTETRPRNVALLACIKY